MSVVVIAEAGVNHNGSIDLAKKLVDAASDAGADYVKFQTFKAETLVSKAAKMAEYQIKNTNEETSQFAMLKKLELTEKAHFALIDYCKSKNIEFLSTPFNFDDADFLEDKVSLIKVPSGDLNNYPYLKYLAKKMLPMVVSTGMSTLEEILKAKKAILSTWEEMGKKPSATNISPLTFLHCTSNYPTLYNEVNLNVLHTLKEELDLPIGYSDHTLGISVPVAAVAMGSVVIEKHFTLDKNMPGPDHKASLEPHELKEMITQIRNIEMSLGSAVKAPTESELKTREIARKSLHFANDLNEGATIRAQDIEIKRPGTGLAPEEYDNIIGKTLTKKVEADDMILEEHFK